MDDVVIFDEIEEMLMDCINHYPVPEWIWSNLDEVRRQYGDEWVKENILTGKILEGLDYGGTRL